MLHTFTYTQSLLALNKPYNDLKLVKGDTLKYSLVLDKNKIFQFAINQQGIALAYELTGSNQIMKSKRPGDITGMLKSEFKAGATGTYLLKIYR